jgi:hypothetical protein
MYIEGIKEHQPAYYKVYAHRTVFEAADNKRYMDAPENMWCDETRTLLRRPRIPSGTEEWLKVRDYLLTATNIAPIKKIKGSFKSRNRILNDKVWGSVSCDNVALSYGRENETVAIHIMRNALKLPIFSGDVGLTLHPDVEALIFGNSKENAAEMSTAELVEKIIAYSKLHPDIPLLSATPDAICLLSPFLIEIKSPFNPRNFNPHKIHPRYFEQIQCQMEVCAFPACYFVQFLPAKYPYEDRVDCYGHITIARVQFDPEWIDRTLPELQDFVEDVTETKELKEKQLINCPKSHMPRVVVEEPDPVCWF